MKIRRNKFFAAALAVVCIAALAAGCTKEEPKTDETATPPTEETTTAPDGASEEKEAVKDGEAADANEADPAQQTALIYGKVKEVIEEDGKTNKVVLDTDEIGEMVLNLSDDTVWIDSEAKTASDPKTLAEGEEIYVFHSIAVTNSLPPQTAAFAIIRSVPQDASCAIYMTVDSVEQDGEQVKISANYGEYEVITDKDTAFSDYKTKNVVTAADVKEGSTIAVWYTNVGETSTNQADHIMILPNMK